MTGADDARLVVAAHQHLRLLAAFLSVAESGAATTLTTETVTPLSSVPTISTLPIGLVTQSEPPTFQSGSHARSASV